MRRLGHTVDWLTNSKSKCAMLKNKPQRPFKRLITISCVKKKFSTLCRKFFERRSAVSLNPAVIPLNCIYYGCSFHYALMWNKSWISICWRHLLTSKESSNPSFFSKKTYFTSNLRNILWATILYKYNGIWRSRARDREREILAHPHFGHSAPRYIKNKVSQFIFSTRVGLN